MTFIYLLLKDPMGVGDDNYFNGVRAIDSTSIIWFPLFHNTFNSKQPPLASFISSYKIPFPLYVQTFPHSNQNSSFSSPENRIDQILLRQTLLHYLSKSHSILSSVLHLNNRNYNQSYSIDSNTSSLPYNISIFGSVLHLNDT